MATVGFARDWLEARGEIGAVSTEEGDKAEKVEGAESDVVGAGACERISRVNRYMPALVLGESRGSSCEDSRTLSCERGVLDTNS